MATKGKTIKRSIKDSVSASGGGGAGSQAPGIRARHDGGGGGQIPVQESQPQEQAKQQSQLNAYQQRAAVAQQQYQQQKEAGIRETREARERASQKTTTGVYEKGGAVIRETKGDYQTLQRLKAQQPGSAVVQTQSGEYVLIKAQGLNLGSEATLSRVNENIQREGGTPYYPTEKKLPEGGTLSMRRLSDTVKTSEPVPPEGGGPVVQQSDFLIDTSKPTKYTAKVGEGTVYAEQEGGRDISITLDETLSFSTPGYQKTRLKSAREQAEDITSGESPFGFVGPKTVLVEQREEQAAKEQGFAEDQVFPITYTTEKGEPLVTITGKSKGSEFNIYQPGKSISVTLTPTDEIKQQPSKPESPSIGIERELKAAGKPLYAAAVETFAPLITKPLRLMGKKEEADKIVRELNPSYEKYVKPPPGATPLENLIETGQLTTGRGLASDIAGYTTAGILMAGGVPTIRLTKLKPLLTTVKSVFTKQPKSISKAPLAEEYTPGRYPVSRFPATYPEGELVEFQTQRIPLGKGITKQPSLQVTKPIKPVELEREYTPGRYPVSRFPETYGITKTGYAETKLSLGKGIGKPASSSRFTQTQVQLGKGEVKVPGRDFTKETLGLGAGVVKTPPRIIGKPEGTPQPVKEQFGYTPGRYPVSRFPATYPKGELAGYTETRIPLGKGIIKFPKEGGMSAKRFTGPKPPTKPSPEAETRITKGLLLLMEKPTERKTFTSTKIALGTSDKILQIRGGKVISDTLTKKKIKSPSETFFTPAGRGVSISEETRRYPPSAKLTFPTLSLLGTSKEQTQLSQEIIRKTNLQEKQKIGIVPSITERATITTTTQKLTQREKQKEKVAFPAIFPTRQSQQLSQPLRERPKQIEKLIEVPKEPPLKLRLALPPFPKPRPKRKAEPKEPKSALEWKGNVKESDILGVYKKYDIIYGEKRVEKVSRQERFGKPKRRSKSKTDILGFPITKKAKSNVSLF